MENNKVLYLGLVCGLAMIVLTGLMMNAFPHKAELPAGFQSPIIAFEFARSEADIGYLVGNSTSSVQNREGMRAGHRWDMGFPFAYAGLLFALTLLYSPKSRRRTIALLSCVLIVPFDINENLVLLGIVDAAQWGGLTQALFDNLYVATWLKWGAIAVAVAFLAAAYARQSKWLRCILASAYAGLALLALLLNSPARLVELMALVLSVFFLAAFAQMLYEWYRSDKSIKA